MSSTESVYQYLKIQNRPYSVNDIVNNLKNVSKTNVQKSLDKLVDRKKIFEKTYGKQKVYCVVQDSSEGHDEILRIERELERHALEVSSKKAEVERELRSKEAELNALKSSLSVEDGKKEKDRLLNSIKDLEERLDTVRKANGNVDLADEKKKASKNLEIYSKEYSKRKRICNDMIGSILEGYPGTKKDLYQDIGIEIVEV